MGRVNRRKEKEGASYVETPTWVSELSMIQSRVNVDWLILLASLSVLLSVD